MRRLADLVVRWPWMVIGVWVAMAVALPLTFPSPERDGPEASARHPAQRCSVERRRQQDDRGVSRIGFGQPARTLLSSTKAGSDPPTKPSTARCVDALRDDVTDVVIGAGLRHHASTATVPDQQGQDDLGAAGRPCGRVGYAAGVRGLQPSSRHRQTQRRPGNELAHWPCTSPDPRPPSPTSPSRANAIGCPSRSRSASWCSSFCWWCTATRSPCCCRW